MHSAKAHYQADEAWVITNSRFTPAALQLAKECEVTLIDRERLVRVITETQVRI